MSYIPDYRKETDKLSKEDKMYIMGYRAAIEDMKTIFGNLDVYEVTEEEERVLNDFKDCFSDWCDMEETGTVLSLFENGQYDDLELTDGNANVWKGGLKHGRNPEID